MQSKENFYLNIRFPCKTIHFLESMIKFERDENYVHYPSINSLEICGMSYKSSTTSLSRSLITLLTYGEVPKYFFIKLVINAIETVQNELKDESKDWIVVKKFRDLDDDKRCLIIF